MNNNEPSNFDEIDLRLFFYFLYRNIKFISIISFIFFIVACFYSLSIKRVWEGQFQIVLSSEEKRSNITLADPSLSNILNANRTSDLNTQVSILKSP